MGGRGERENGCGRRECRNKHGRELNKRQWLHDITEKQKNTSAL